MVSNNRKTMQLTDAEFGALLECFKTLLQPMSVTDLKDLTPEELTPTMNIYYVPGLKVHVRRIPEAGFSWVEAFTAGPKETTAYSVKVYF